MSSRSKTIEELRAALTPDGRSAVLLEAMFDRARRVPEYARDLEDWFETATWLMLRRAAAPFGDFHESRAFAGALYELQAVMESLHAPAD